MTKKKLSATVDPERLAEALELTGSTNVSSVIDRTLNALVDRERERRWLAAHPATDLPGEVAPDLSPVAWEDD